MSLKPPVERHQIQCSHRLGPKTDKQGARRTPPFVLRFRSEATRDKVLRARFQLKGHNEQHPGERIFLNKYLTAIRTKLACDASVLKKAGKVTDTWTTNGNILTKN
ncbi:hypothetical protein LSAT2_008474 [Lamellibrachia satsuma]|nr:hypothetical protein LSAT2_008474 [Lamellibrachia satsuma]